jgi:hypothetical protein
MRVKMALRELCRLAAALVRAKARQSALGLNEEMVGLFIALRVPWRPRLTEKVTLELEFEEQQLELTPATSPRRRKPRVTPH